MIFSSDELTKFEYNGTEYPLRCDLVVLEKIQNMTGDILQAEDLLRGYRPRVDKDGMIDRTIGTWTFPDVALVTQALVWMMEEGKVVTEGDYDIPTVEEMKQQDEYSLNEMALPVFTEFERCIAGKKKKTVADTPKKTATKTQTRKRS